ncbi:MAG: trypsin-like serine protease [Deltaproteobacteria bacterium]|nr:trypsin-like serine protease [Deltaproteobacteria bacterium]
MHILRCLPLLLLVAPACSAPAADEDDPTERNSQIVGGSKASAHEEAALINMLNSAGYQVSACSGSVIAPKVVLTAGHCVDGVAGFQVIAPYTASGKQTARSKRWSSYDWKDVYGSSVDPTLHDVGLIMLDTPITLGKWPKVRSKPIAFGQKAVNIGRINNGSFSSTDLFVSKPITMLDGKGYGYPFDYYSTEVIQSGDSGGPVEVPGTFEIIAVNSGAGGGTQVLARVDLLWGWIDEQVKANGGWPTPDGGGDPGGTPGDADGDGVGDGSDLCSKTPEGAPVWTAGEWIGCAGGQVRDGGGGADSDGDGIPDARDRCGASAGGAPVWPYGEWMGCAAGQNRD